MFEASAGIITVSEISVRCGVIISIILFVVCIITVTFDKVAGAISFHGVVLESSELLSLLL